VSNEVTDPDFAITGIPRLGGLMLVDRPESEKHRYRVGSKPPSDERAPVVRRLRRARPCGLCRIQTTILNGKRTLIMDILDNSERNSRFLELRRYASETSRSLNQEWLKKKPDRARVRTLMARLWRLVRESKWHSRDSVSNTESIGNSEAKRHYGYQSNDSGRSV
jgi:hypothetical protein